MIEKIMKIYPLRFFCMTKDKEHIWFSACEFNGLFRYHLKDETVDYIGMFPGEEDRPWIHNAAVEYNDKIFFCPFYSQKISVYDKRKGNFECYPIFDREPLQCRFRGAGKYKEFLFFWSDISKEVVRFNMEKKEYEYVRLSAGSDDENYEMSAQGFCVVDDNIYIPTMGVKGILQINMKKNEKTYHSFHEKGSVYTICFDGTQFWLTDTDNYLIEWQQGGTIKKYLIEGQIPIRNAILGVFINSTIYYSILETEDLLSFHVDTQSFEYIRSGQTGEKYWGYKDYKLCNFMLKVLDNKVWCFNSTYSLLQNIEGNKVLSRKLVVRGNADQFLEDRWRAYFLLKTSHQKQWDVESASVFYEGEDNIIDMTIEIGVEDYVRFVLSLKTSYEDDDNCTLSNGERIYLEI